MSNAHSRLVRAATAAALASSLLIPATAEAWWGGGVVIGVPPVVVGPPAYAYPPPYYYPPAYYPPAYYPPPPAQQSRAPQLSQDQRPYGSTCFAGVYTCAAEQDMRVGDGCSCPGLGAPSYGSVR